LVGNQVLGFGKINFQLLLFPTNRNINPPINWTFRGNYQGGKFLIHSKNGDVLSNKPNCSPAINQHILAYFAENNFLQAPKKRRIFTSLSSKTVLCQLFQLL